MPGWTKPWMAGLVVVIVVIASLWALQRRLIYFPDRAAPPVPAGVREVSYRTEDGLTLKAWYVPSSRPGAPVVLVAPGNAGNRSYRLPLATALASRGLSVLLVDYRGYGGNPGSPSETGLTRDVRAARGYLTEELGAGRVLYFGESLGAAVITRLAVTHPPAGLLLRSPFSDLASVGREHYPFLPVGALLKDRFPVADQIGRVEAPAAVVYGDADSIVPPRQSREVARRVTHLVREVVVPGADHNDQVLLDGPQLVDAVLALNAAQPAS
ncbi:alpha/beta hydrolase [Actinomadura rudentiformis]|nr:alpha/beta hydrolase [Actinomadura rudentiformis]